MLFVGVDLTSAFAATPRAIDVAWVDDSLTCHVSKARWPGKSIVISRDARALWEMLDKAVPSDGARRIWALDGPQGLAAAGRVMRLWERNLGALAKTPDVLPLAEPGHGVAQDYVRSSLDLFAALVAHGELRLAHETDAPVGEASLFEVYPGAEWRFLSGRPLPSKARPEGRAARKAVLEALGVKGLPELPTADENDALIGAYLAWATRHAPAQVRLVGEPPRLEEGELREGHLLHLVERPANVQEIAPSLAVSPAPKPSLPSDELPEHDGLFLLLTDLGLVHGSAPDNGWLRQGTNYRATAIGPAGEVVFDVNHSPTFSGGRGWTLRPTAKSLLQQLGYDSPSSLSGKNFVRLPLHAVELS